MDQGDGNEQIGGGAMRWRDLSTNPGAKQRVCAIGPSVHAVTGAAPVSLFDELCCSCLLQASSVKPVNNPHLLCGTQLRRNVCEARTIETSYCSQAQNP